MTWLPIAHWEWYDFPRLFVVGWRNRLYSFRCPFDDVKEDYTDHFEVRELPPDVAGTLAFMSWDELVNQGEIVGRIPVGLVHFRETVSRTTARGRAAVPPGTKLVGGKVVGGVPGTLVDDEVLRALIPAEGDKPS